ncbi:CDGSH iron-sulfur domain-containing protein [Brachybacterium sacelli]|uniref:Uncharacterized protein n=1 Tax=Brachybacterium sacelli TaxID=173364 RepID=A0ABS4WZQ3_9MICO|nr:CDGSH iron-sulfur domain-containing protein [Brachybacterium sacelli]MBP2381697.1 hypothetical protein [Brachybacterium sacelli]
MSDDITDAHPEVIRCPGGPMLLRGEHVVQDEEGNEHRTWRAVSAVCMCGGSAIKPVVRRHPQGDAEEARLPLSSN